MTTSDAKRLDGAKKLFAAVCALAFLARQGHAALYEVVDPGNASLGSSLASATSAPTTTDTIFFSPFLTSSLITPTGGPYTVNKTGGNTLDLDGNQATTIDFAPGLTVAAGVLNINGLTTQGTITVTGGTLSTSYSTIGGLVLNGGTFQTRDNSVTSGITLGAGGGTIDTAGSSPMMNGITGGGGLTVKDSVGNGMLILNGANSYTGNTFVNSGTLQLGVASALPAAGSLTTASGGTFDLNGYSQTLATVNNAAGTVKTGLGTLTAATYTGGGTLSVALQSGLTNLRVTGTAALNNGTLSVTGHPSPGVYTVVSAPATQLNGQFLTTLMPFGVTDTLTCKNALGTCLIDILSDTPFTFAGQSANQAAVGAALNAALATASGDLNSVINQLSAMTPAQTNAALDQIGPAAYAALSGMSLAGSGLQAAAVNQRLTGLQTAGASGDGSRFASFAVNGGGSYPGTLVAELPGDATAAYAGDKDRLYDPNSPWGFFVSGLGSFDRLDSINGASGAQPGYSVDARGGTFGADYRFGDHFAAGASAGYVNSFATLDSDAGTVYGQSARFGVYGTVYDDKFHGNLYLGGAHDFYSVSRNIAALSRTATASPTGTEFNMDATGGWDVKTAHAVVSPFLGLAYDRLMLGSFAENGAGSLDLALAGQTAESLRSTMGVKVSRQFKPGWCDLRPFASAAWQHELENQSRALDASLASGGAGSFTVNTADVAREAALLAAGLDMDWTPGFSTRLSYQSTLRSDFSAKTFSASLRLRF